MTVPVPVALCDPRPGTVVELEPGGRLAVTFRPRIGASRWQVTDADSRLVPLADGGHEFQFLLFGGLQRPTRLRFERRHPERDMAHEVCELTVVPVTGGVSAAGRTPTTAAPRTASA